MYTKLVHATDNGIGLAMTGDRENVREHLFPIRTVAKLTGVNPITLRAWERRYGLIKPQRTETHHRLYTQQDIDLIHKILGLLERGIPIGQVNSALREQTTAHPAETADPWARFRARMVAAIARFDEGALEEIYNEALAQFPIEVVTEQLILSLLNELGWRWATQEGSVAEEHFFGCFLRNKLGARFHHMRSEGNGPRLLLACVERELHEIGLLLFALSAKAAGYRVTLLGANTPLGNLAIAARRARCDAIVLSSSLDETLDPVLGDLARLTQATELPVFVGGKASVTHHDAISRTGAIPVGTNIQLGLKRIGDELALD